MIVQMKERQLFTVAPVRATFRNTWGGSAPMRTDRNPPACRPHPTAPHTPRNGPYLKERTGMS
ncbi:hypothetical protein SCANM124S_02865 [Streptomyces canus]